MTAFTAAHPLFLALLPVAAAPIVFHLFFRLRKRPRIVSSLLFFHRLDPKLNARRRLREWLILALRCLLIALLLLTLARPRWIGVGPEGPVAVVVVADNSGSMSGKGSGGRSKLEEAIDAAHRFLARLRPLDLAGLVSLVEDPMAPLPQGLMADKTPLKEALSRLTRTEATGSLGRPLEQAIGWLESGPAGRGEIHIFSDLQAAKWNRARLELKAPKSGPVIVVHRVPTPPSQQANVSLAGLDLPEKTVLAGRRFPVRVSLVNPSAFPASVRLNWRDDQDHAGLLDVALPPSASTNATLRLSTSNPGMHWVNFWIEGDEFSADNRGSLGVFSAEKQTVLFLGRREEFGALPIALSPTSDGALSGLIPRFIDAVELPDRLRAPGMPFLVVTWEGLARLPADTAAWRSLQQFWESGGNGLLVPAAAGTGTDARPSAWPGPWPTRRENSAAGLALRVLNASASVFNELRDERGEVAWQNVKVFQFHPLPLAATDTALLGLEDGRALLVQRNSGKGILFASGIAFERSWANLPLKPAFLSLAQNLVLARSAMAQPVESIIAGETFRLPSTKSDSVQVRSLAGSPLDWSGRRESFPGFPRAGFYTVQAGAELKHIAVRASDPEGRQQFLTGDTLPALGQLAYSVQPLSSTDFPASRLVAGGQSLELYLPLWLLAVATLLTEGWLANPPPLTRRPPTPAVSWWRRLIQAAGRAD